MRRTLAVITLAVAAFAAGSAATAATGWKVFATASDNSDFLAYATADSKVVAPKALALRVSGQVDEVSWYLSCDGKTKTRRSGVSVVAVGTADTCTLSGTASGEGLVRVQLLRR